jgi:AAA domain
MTAVHEISAANGHARSRSTAAVQAQSKLARICQELAVEPIETIDETLRHCLPLVEEMLALGLVDRGDAADQLYDAFVANGLVQQRGPDAVQRIMADALSPKEPNDSGVREAAGRAWADTIKIERKPSWRDQTFTAAALQKQTFPPVRYVVPGLVPEGLTLFCGRPKIGKSWAGLDIAVAVASGGEWGRPLRCTRRQ